jgi:hypothetical protein
MDSQPLVNRAPWSEVSQKSLGANRRRVLFCPRLCENHSSGHLGTTLIQTARRTRIKHFLRLRLRFYCCVPTTASCVFTQPRPFADSLQPLGPALPCGSHRPVDPLGKFLGVQLRRALDRIGAPARFIAAVTLTGVAFFGAAFFAM